MQSNRSEDVSRVGVATFFNLNGCELCTNCSQPGPAPLETGAFADTPLFRERLKASGFGIRHKIVKYHGSADEYFLMGLLCQNCKLIYGDTYEQHARARLAEENSYLDAAIVASLAEASFDKKHHEAEDPDLRIALLLSRLDFSSPPDEADTSDDDLAKAICLSTGAATPDFLPRPPPPPR